MTARLKRDRLPYRWLQLIAPIHALEVARYETAMVWVRLTRSSNCRHCRHASELMVNVGCGDKGKPRLGERGQ